MIILDVCASKQGSNLYVISSSFRSFLNHFLLLLITLLLHLLSISSSCCRISLSSINTSSAILSSLNSIMLIILVLLILKLIAVVGIATYLLFFLNTCSYSICEENIIFIVEIETKPYDANNV